MCWRNFAKHSVREGSPRSLHPSVGLDFVSQTVTIHTAFVLHERFAASAFSVVGSPPCGSMMKQVFLLFGKLWNSRRPPSCSTILRETWYPSPNAEPDPTSLTVMTALLPARRSVTVMEKPFVECSRALESRLLSSCLSHSASTSASRGASSRSHARAEPVCAVYSSRMV